MTAVVFYMSYTKDINGHNTIPKEEVRADVKVIPQQIVSLGGIYTYFANCWFIDGNGELIWPDVYRDGGPNSGPAYFLIRNSDGEVFHDSRVQLSSIIPPMYNSTNDWITIHFDAKNDMYYSVSTPDSFNYNPKPAIKKLTTQGENLVVQEITPYDMGVYSFVLSDTEGVTVGGKPRDGVFEQSYDKEKSTVVYYPNGGFEIISLPSITLCAVGGQFKTFEQEERYIAESNTNMCKTTINNMLFTSHPPYSLNIEATDESLFDKSRMACSFSIDCKDHYVIGGSSWNARQTRLCVVNKGSKEMQFITLDKFPASRYTFSTDYPDRIGNTIFSIDGNTKTIQSYNFETLQYREVQYDDSELGGFFERGTSFKNDPPTYIKYGTRGSDGKPVTVEINVETGATKVTVGEDSRETIILVRIA